jgi:hypothetical protein
MGRAPLIYSTRGPSRRCTGYDSVAHPVICFSELGGCRPLLLDGQVGCTRPPPRARLPTPPWQRIQQGLKNKHPGCIFLGVYGST